MPEPIELAAMRREATTLPAQPVEVSQFWIDQYEVTNAQYAAFLAAAGGTPPSGWADANAPAGQSDYPVEGVTWDQAAAFCQWAGKRLPSEAEWEVAARGPKGSLYPWGDDERTVTLPDDRTYAVGQNPANRSAFGVYDMAGNVWEWVGDTYAPVPESKFCAEAVTACSGIWLIGCTVNRMSARCLPWRVSGVRPIRRQKEVRHDSTSILLGDVSRCDRRHSRLQHAAGATSRWWFIAAGDCPSDCWCSSKKAALPAGVLYQDDFSDPQSGWPIVDVDNYRFGYHPPDFYHVEVKSPHDSLPVFHGLNFGDASVETTALVDHTATETGDYRYGLALRRSGSQYYAFTVSPRSKSWQIAKHSPQGVKVLSEGAITTLQGYAPRGVTPDKKDDLRVDAVGPNFVFFVNGRNVAHVSDAEYPSGDVGFVVETVDESLVHVHYDALVISKPKQNADVLFEDDFSNPDGGWPKVDFNNYRFGYHPPDFYHVEVKAPHDSLTVFRGMNFGDASVENDGAGGSRDDRERRLPLWPGAAPIGRPVLRLHGLAAHESMADRQTCPTGRDRPGRRPCRYAARFCAAGRDTGQEGRSTGGRGWLPLRVLHQRARGGARQRCRLCQRRCRFLCRDARRAAHSRSLRLTDRRATESPRW